MAIALCIILVQGLPQVIISRTQIIGDPGGPGFTFSIPDFPITSRTAIIDPPYTIPTDLPTISTSTKLTLTSKTSTSKYSEYFNFIVGNLLIGFSYIKIILYV